MNDLVQEIRSIKEELGDNIVIPAHHYQRDEIVALADFLGDSYKLAVDCSKTDAQYILFCGVHFMAEGAAVVAGKHQLVVTPDPGAGCPMADMIDNNEAEKAYAAMSSLCPREIIPVIYMNSSASMKAFCGARNGAVCTSSNAVKIVRHYLDAGKSVFFSPDYNLGVNVANELGLTRDELVLINRDGTVQPGGSEDARLYIWDGYCHVHKSFSVDDILALRRQYSDIQIIVHPECTEQVVAEADFAGSTSMIYNRVKNAPAGTVWGIGTEHNFVSRIASECSDKTVVALKKSLCTDMNVTNLDSLATTIRAVGKHFRGEGELHNQVTVPESHRRDAKKAMERMIAIVEQAG
ncbi:quinolinate synthase NadA [Desulforhopalus singaporensis]|uniref:Quinolinate synthase n=1 Tax=Desulforhopalus singaporensis TaxID=91360 RepID=A0A1H0U1K2_9BACT|nr:quinolinate synthase NadA [Desulforhopalus singaporensis]SDP60054.1 quinolinate synthetase [Desulforhopalus singaporensis]